MTTTTERLLQIAEQYDQKAAALRLAASELHEERAQTSTKTFGRRLNLAIQARADTRNGGNGPVTKAQRQEIIRNYMSDGKTHTVSDVIGHLSEHHHLSPGRNIVWLDVKRGIGAKPDPNVKYGYRLTNGSSNGHTTRDFQGNQTEGRRKVILAVLRRGPQQIKTIQVALNEAGYMIQRDRTRQFITEHIPEARCIGVAHNARWILGTPGKKAGQAAKRKKGTSVNVRAQRQASAKFLAQFNTTSPLASPKGEMKSALGVYVRRGYLQKTDGGYLRTAKPFSLNLP